MSRKKKRINTQEQANLLLAQGIVIGPDGGHIGKIGQVFQDIDTGQLNWVTVKTGWFGSSESFIPLQDATITGDEVRVPYDKAMIKGARHQLTDGELTAEDQDELYEYYQLAQASSDTAASHTAPDGGKVLATDADAEMIRSEERLQVSTRKVEAGRARLRKYIVTEQQSVTVPVSHEEVRVLRKPITDANRDHALADLQLADEVHEVVLTQDRVVVNKETVPVERINLGTHTVTEQRQVTETIRKEQIEFDDTNLQTHPTGPRKRKR
ncbi:MAG: PRC and DUF2382 domain-containing protein [Actinomycetota bacterium]|nr:PRC and DUF2382 domain-containing protein [Actinomycetota bacterium]